MSLIPAFAGIYQELANVNKNKICFVILSLWRSIHKIKVRICTFKAWIFRYAQNDKNPPSLQMGFFVAVCALQVAWLFLAHSFK